MNADEEYVRTAEGAAIQLSPTSTRPGTAVDDVMERTVVRCPNPKCRLNQFEPDSGNCRRCSAQLRPFIQKPRTDPFIPLSQTSSDAELWAEATSLIVKAHRGATSQQRLANTMNVPRTYVSKVERRLGMPLPESLEKFAKALHVPMAEFISSIDKLKRLLAETERP